MRHQLISFQNFKETYINKPDGFMPVYSCFNEEKNQDGYLHMTQEVLIDLICEWRLSDGKMRFLRVPFSNQEELEEIKTYLKVCAKILHDKIIKSTEQLTYNNKAK